MCTKAQWQPLGFESIQQKARILQKIRAFFMTEHVLEIMTPLVSPYGVTDPNIESLRLDDASDGAYLQTSPEFFMKRLLASGSGSIYQIAHAFRAEEQGRHHLQEFTLVEWYMQGWDYGALMQQIEKLLDVVSEHKVSVKTYTYEQVFLNYLGFSPFEISTELLEQRVDIQGLDRDGLLDYCLSIEIMPKMQNEGWFFIKDYPASQASLARLNAQNNQVAERFELFYNGVELANGFSELQDAAVQRQRFELDNVKRQQQCQKIMPIDEAFIAALEVGLPQCSGVALGLERLMMVLLGSEDIRQVGMI